MLAAVHGVFDRSICTLTSPRLVSKVSTWKPLCGTFVGGVPTSLMPGGRERVGLAPGEALAEALAEKALKRYGIDEVVVLGRAIVNDMARGDRAALALHQLAAARAGHLGDETAALLEAGASARGGDCGARHAGAPSTLRRL